MKLKRRTTVKRIFSVLFALAVSAALVVPTTNAQSVCDVATLTGNYAFSNSGFTTPRSPEKGGIEVPFAVVGVFAFDGAGNISTSFTFATIRTGIHLGMTSSGTYTVNSDCTGSISFTTGDAAGIDFNTAIVGGGTEIFGIETTPSFAGTFDAKKQ